MSRFQFQKPFSSCLPSIGALLLLWLTLPGTSTLQAQTSSVQLNGNTESQTDSSQKRIHSRYFQRVAQNTSNQAFGQTISNQDSASIGQTFRNAMTANNSPFSQANARPKTRPVKTVATHLKGFGIPFQLSNTDESFVEVQLYISRDGGQNWKFYGRQSTDLEEFPFEADEDGEYWFSIKTLNRDRKLLPEGNPLPELKIIVDTKKPELDFRIESDAAGRVACRWAASDKHIAPQSLQILYQPVSDDSANPNKGNWVKVPVELKGSARNGLYADQIAWWPETTARLLNVAVEVADIAGNKTQVYRQVSVAPTAWRHRQNSTARITDTPKRAGAINNPWVTPQTIKGPVTPATSQPDSQNQTAQRVPNPKVVCKDGVCQIVDPAHNGPDRSANQMNQVGHQTRRPNDQFEAFPPNDTSPEISYGNFAPPQVHQAQRPVHGMGRQNVEWQSESEQWVTRNHSSFGSTMNINPGLAPRPPLSHRPPATDVASNPATMQFDGDMVIGESSTAGATNQYRGQNSFPNATTPNLTFMPGTAGVSEQPSGDRATAQSGQLNHHQASSQTQLSPIQRGHRNEQGEWNMPGSGGHQGNFEQAGYPRPHANHSHIQTQNETSLYAGGRTNASTQIIGAKRFRLNYGIDAIDPSGVAKVDLWMTRDRGQTWDIWGSDPDNQSPFPVEVEEEGHFGFRVVVHSRDGLTGQGPSSGDDADMWILIDTTSPLTRITSVPYGRNLEAGRLVINYSVSDPFLTLRPVTISWAANPKGPWNVIGEGLRNDGRHVWKPAPGIPDRIFLKIEAIDKAGNLGVHNLNQAIDVSGLVPRGTIHGVIPVGR